MNYRFSYKFFGNNKPCTSNYAQKDLNESDGPNSQMETVSLEQNKRIVILPKENVRAKLNQKIDKDEIIGNKNNTKTINESI